MIDILTRTTLEALSRPPDGPGVSLYLPTQRTGVQVQQNPIRLKNLLDQAEERLFERDWRRPEVDALLAPARDLVPDRPFWQTQADGLALFLGRSFFARYRLPFDFEPQVVVADRFHLKPLLPVLSGDGRFYVLAISQDEVRLLQGTRYSVDEIDLEGVPPSLAEALRFDDPERQLQFHTSTRTPGGAGARPALYHGQGVGTDDEKTNILRYFHKVDAGLCRFLSDERAPLVLASVAYLQPIYREANTCAHLVDEGVEGNPEELKPDELHARAWRIVQPIFGQAQQAAAARYHLLEGEDSPLAASDPAAVVPAAHYGRVETLFVALGLQRWGTFDPETGETHFKQRGEPGAEDLLDVAAVQTLLNDGMVYAVEPEQVPGGELLAAVLRY